MRRICRILPSILLISMLCGCVPHDELNERIIVQALGIDGGNGDYTVTLQYYHMGGSGGQNQIDASQTNVLTASGKGGSIYAALEEAGINSGRSLLYGENRVIILGKSVCEEPLDTTLSFFTSDYQCNPDIMVVTADEKASDILSVKYKEGIVSTENIEYMLKNADKEGFVTRMGMYEIMTDMQNRTQSVCLPRLAVVESGTDTTEDGKQVHIIGGTLFREGKFAALTDISEMSGIAFLRNEVENASVTTEVSGRDTAIGLFDSGTSVRFAIEDKKPVFIVNVTAKGRFYENHTSLTDVTETAEIEKKVAQTLGKRIKSAAEKMANEYGADAFRLENLVRHNDYSDWIRVEDEWEEVLKNCEFRVNCEIEIVRYGLES